MLFTAKSLCNTLHVIFSHSHRTKAETARRQWLSKGTASIRFPLAN